MEGEKFVINRYAQETMRFAPGTVSIPSGCMLTFTYRSKPSDAHTLTIVPKAALPRTPAQIMSCPVCRKYGTGHLKNPHAPPGPANGIVHFVLDQGNPGLDTVGDSIAIVPSAGHRKISVPVSAPAGTTLYFICAVHPWMQGKIVVT